MKRIDWSKPVRMKADKRPVEVVTTKARSPLPVAVYIGDSTVMSYFTMDGRFSEGAEISVENVEMLYLNIYINPSSQSSKDKYIITQHSSRGEAVALKDGNCISTAVIDLGV